MTQENLKAEHDPIALLNIPQLIRNLQSKCFVIEDQANIRAEAATALEALVAEIAMLREGKSGRKK